MHARQVFHCYGNWQYTREEVSKRKEASAWPLGTKFVMLSYTQKITLGHIEVETKKFISKSKSKDRKIEHNPDMAVGTSVNRCNECSNIRDIYGKTLG
jgi:hypothetical protein